jgi:hypothetical protein
MRSSLCLLVGLGFTAALGCTGPDREAFPDGGSATASSGASPTSSGSTGGPGTTSSDGTGAGGTSSVGPGDGGGPVGPGSGGGGNEPVGTGGDGGGGGTGGTGGGTGGGPVCDPVGNACLPPVPGGWTGPLALFEVAPAESLPSCNLTGWPTTLGDYFGDLDEGTAICDCDCEPAAGIVCNGNPSYCSRGNMSQCNLVCTPTPFTSGACLPAVSPVYLSLFAPTPSNVGSCTAEPTVELPTAEWGVKSRACQGATTTPDGCDAGEVCAPRPVGGEMCIVSAGDVACPGSGWNAKHLRHTSFADTRDCSACSCGGATSTCGGTLFFTDPGSSNCGAGSFLVDTVNAGACSALDDASYMQYQPSPSGTCPPSGGALSGDVTLDGTATYCCTE